MGGDAFMTKELWSIMGDAGEGTLMTFPPDPAKDSANAELVAKFKTQKYEPEGYTLYAYTAVKLWADVVNKIGYAEPRKVAAAMKAGTI